MKIQIPQIRSVLVALCLGPLASAQNVHVVDGAAGPGSQFTVIQDAIDAAAEGDLLLIRAGFYSGGIAIDGKEVELQADTGAFVSVNGQVVVENLSAAQHVSLRDLEIGSSPDPVVSIRNNTGVVWLQNLDHFSLSGGPIPNGAFEISSCDAVVLTDVDFAPGGSSPDANPAGPGLSIRDSEVAMFDCVVTGAVAAGMTEAGSTALVAQDSIVTIQGGTIEGGLGRDLPPFFNGQGGTGLEVTGTSGATVVNRVDVTIRGGQILPFGGTPPTGSPGSAIEFTGAGGVVNVTSDRLHRLSTPSPLRSGEATTLTITGRRSEMLFVLFTLEPGLLTSFGGGTVPLLLPPTAGVIPFGSLPSTSPQTTVVRNFTAPPVSLDSETYYLQLLVLGTPAFPKIRFGSGAVVHVLDPSF